MARPLLLTSTDARTPKVRQLAQNARVEIAWWIPGIQEQFRIAGRAYVLPSPEFGTDTVVPPVGEVLAGEKAQMELGVRKLEGDFPGAELGGEGFDWEGKRVEVFDTMSGHMKASWVRPVPGTPLPGGYAAAKEWPESLPKLSEVEEGDGGEESKRLLKDALKNFALVVIDPMEVDYVELGVMPNQRTNFRLDKSNGEWVEEIVVP